MPEKQKEYRKKAWEGYDYDELPEMTPEQLATFERVSSERLQQQSEMRRVGRPRKSEKEKEIPISIRIPFRLLEQLKLQAEEAHLPWQTFMKKVLDDKLNELVS